MAAKVKFPIRLKLFLLMSGFMLLATASYLILATQLFNDDKIQLVYELNASAVKTLAAETESSLAKIIDKVKLLTQGHRDLNWTRSVFESEPDLIAYTLYSNANDAAQWKTVSTFRNSEYLKVYGLAPTEIDRLRTEVPVPFDQVLSKGIWVANATLPGGAPILTLALSIEIRTENGMLGHFVAVVDVRLDRILKSISNRKLTTVYLIDTEGKVLAHPNAAWVSSRKSLGDIPIVQEAVKSPVAFQLKKFDWEGTRWLGAFASVGIGGLTVISQVPESEAFLASQVLIRKSLLFALILLTSSLIVSRALARSFTQSLQRLVKATERLSRWEFGQLVHVKGRDEIASLARAFNSMATDLQAQRQQLDAANSDLEKKVAKRTAELNTQRKKVSEAQDTLIRTTRLASLGELAGAAAHEVLNPINNMNIRVERIASRLKTTEKNDIFLLTEITTGWKTAYTQGGWASLEAELKKITEDQKKTLGQEDLENLVAIATDLQTRLAERTEDMEFLGKEIIRITRIINNMRYLSRVGGERRPVDVHIPIEETALTLGDLFQKNKISFVKDYSADSHEGFAVVADKDELVQVFSNLVRNAMHAVISANRRAGTIRVATQKSGDRIEIRITDNGTGISKANLARLFEPNFTTKSMQEGTGLGLSISRRLVRAFGGDLEIEKTSEGNGTTFLIWFPVAS